LKKDRELPIANTHYSFYEITFPWLECDATYQVCQGLSWEQKFKFLTDYSGFVLEHGTVPLEEYRKIWDAERRRAAQVFVTRIARGAVLLGTRRKIANG